MTVIEYYENLENPENQSKRVFLNEEKQAGTCEFSKFRLGFRQYDVILTKRQSVVTKIMASFKEKIMETQFYILGPKVDQYVHDYKLAVEVDEYVDSNRKIDNEIERQKAIEEAFGCKFIKINPDKSNNHLKNIHQ